jgi:phage terminase Nu1 subunit (DNA packaging protein)
VIEHLYAPNESDFDDQRQRLAAAQAEKVEHENAVRRGELARRADVERFWTDCISAARAKFLSIPTRIGARVPPDHRAEVVQIAKEIVYEGLRELSEYEPPLETAAL